MYTVGSLSKITPPDIDSAYVAPKLSIDVRVYENGNICDYNVKAKRDIGHLINGSGLFEVSLTNDVKKECHVEMELFFEGAKASRYSHVLSLCTLAVIPMKIPYAWDATFRVYLDGILFKEYSYTENIVEYWGVLFVPTLGLFHGTPQKIEKNLLRTFMIDFYNESACQSGHVFVDEKALRIRKKEMK